MTNIADLRKSYERAELDEQASSADPMAQFELWLKQAIEGQIPEPNAMTLATVGENGRASMRAASSGTRTMKAARAASWRPIPSAPCSSTGSNWSASFASKAEWSA